MRYAGGGGYGDPQERDPAAVAADLRDGYITAAAARETTGVRLSDDGRTVARSASMSAAPSPISCCTIRGATWSIPASC